MKLSGNSGLLFDAKKTPVLQASPPAGIAVLFFYAQMNPPSEETWV